MNKPHIGRKAGAATLCIYNIFIVHMYIHSSVRRYIYCMQCAIYFNTSLEAASKKLLRVTYNYLMGAAGTKRLLEAKLHAQGRWCY